MNLTISKKIAIETALPCPKSKDLKLSGISSLSFINESLSIALSQGSISNDNTFLNVFGLDNLFFYHAEKVSNNIRLVLERGIGHLISIDNEVYLRRERPVCYYLNDSNEPIASTHAYDLTIDNDNEYIVVSSTLPPSYIELLYEQNAVITSSDSFLPQSVKLDENSVLARLQDKIVSLCLKDFGSLDDFQKAVNEALLSYKNQVTLGCSKLSMKSKRGVISSNIFQLNPTSNPPAKKGTFIYDETDDLLKYYDGSSWRSLAFTKDDLS
jgi:hypothetical protein